MNDEIRRGPGRPRKEVPVTIADEQSDDSNEDLLRRGVSERALDARRKAIATNPLGFNMRLTAHQIPGFKLHWCNDQDGRIDARLNRGWDYVIQGESGIEQVSTDPGDKVSRVVGSLPSGDPLRAYLLKIPVEWYDQDQKEQQKAVDKVDETIRRGQVGRNLEGRYAPIEGISIKTETR